jgi:hypothetical protein
MLSRADFGQTVVHVEVGEQEHFEGNVLVSGGGGWIA